ncbi:MAG: aldose 1-epimerase [Gemmatimonadetes bacterium]|nr:aldose 1-epimerase [Gemmatimonadota bacterium]
MRSLRTLTDRGEVELLAGGEGRHDPLAVPRGTGSPIMAPWPNRIRDGILVVEGQTFRMPLNVPPHALHGTVWSSPFAASVTARDRAGRATACRMSIDLKEPWPFRSRLHVDAGVEGRSLTQTLTIEAAEGERRRFPAGFGWHPFFRRNLGGGDMAVKANVLRRWVTLGDMTATGETVEPAGKFDLRVGPVPAVGSLDVCFSIEPESPVVLTWPEITLTLRSSRTLSHLVVYTAPHATCVEPQSCTIDAFKYERDGLGGTGTAYVSPGRPLVGRTVWTWS